jgi:hypothetical protein
MACCSPQLPASSTSCLHSRTPKDNQFIHDEERAKNGLVVEGLPERFIGIEIVGLLAGEASCRVG